MKQELIQKNKSELKIKNKDVKICIICGNSNVDLHEFGISCENCGVLLWRMK